MEEEQGAHPHPSLPRRVGEMKRQRGHHPPPTASDSAARMNPLMTTFIQIRLIVIMVNN